jgi:integrase/recombinase XerD
MPSRNLAALTRRSYREDLVDLLRFLTARGVATVTAVHLTHLKAFQAEMDRRGYAASTRNRKTQAIRIFCQFLHREGLTGDNIAAQLIPPPIQKCKPRFLGETEYQRLLSACGHNLRDTAMIQLFLQTGMRKTHTPG